MTSGYTAPMRSGPTDPPPSLSPEFVSLLDAPILGRLDLDVVKQHRVAVPSLGSTEEVERIDWEIEGTPTVSVRIHRPKHGSDRAHPCVLSIHGGGFVIGSHDMDDPLFERWTVQFGVVGVSVNYRLAPETTYPGPLEDCYRALQWLHDNSADLNIDRGRIGIWGASAGGGLAAGVALLARDRREIFVCFQILESPMLDDRITTPSSRADGLVVWTREANEFGWRCYLGDLFGGSDVPAYAAPSRAQDLRGLPPTFISVGGSDGFRDENMEYAQRLSQAGVPTELHLYSGAPHGYQMFPDSMAARQSRRDCDEWLARTIGV